MRCDEVMHLCIVIAIVNPKSSYCMQAEVSGSVVVSPATFYLLTLFNKLSRSGAIHNLQLRGLILNEIQMPFTHLSL